MPRFRTTVPSLLVVSILSLGMVSTAAGGSGAASSRPFSDWASAQSSFDPNVPIEFSTVWWYEAATNETLMVDLDGRVAAWIVANGGQATAPTLSGTVTERVLADGSARVTVTEQIQGAITYAWQDINNFADFPNGPGLFGARAEEIVAGARPALGSASFSITFLMPQPGAQLPDFWALAFAPSPGEEILFSHFASVARGPLRAGSGYPDGTPGMASTEQIGNFLTTGGGATADGFPVEWVSVRPVGH